MRSRATDSRAKILYLLPPQPRELQPHGGLEILQLRPKAEVVSISLSCRRSGFPTAIPKRFSSSLTPSFAKGRCTTVFLPRGTAERGAPSFQAGAPR